MRRASVAVNVQTVKDTVSNPQKLILALNLLSSVLIFATVRAARCLPTRHVLRALTSSRPAPACPRTNSRLSRHSSSVRGPARAPLADPPRTPSSSAAPPAGKMPSGGFGAAVGFVTVMNMLLLLVVNIASFWILRRVSPRPADATKRRSSSRFRFRPRAPPGLSATRW